MCVCGEGGTEGQGVEDLRQWWAIFRHMRAEVNKTGDNAQMVSLQMVVIATNAMALFTHGVNGV